MATRAARPRPPRLPNLLQVKIYKSGQTRGADDDVIYQNRVSRSSTVLIPYLLKPEAKNPPDGDAEFESGSITLISPPHYFGTQNIEDELRDAGLALGENAVVFYTTRAQWIANDPEDLGWTAASSRHSPLGGQYVARVAATTAEGGGKIIRGFDTTNNKGAGIRLYEYASSNTIIAARFQLEALFWLCTDAQEVAQAHGMTAEEIQQREAYCLRQCEENGLLDMAQLREARIVNEAGHTTCPLCLEELSARGFFSKVEQAEGREVHDLTVTTLNLFHVEELRYGVYNHRPYNLGWGHHHCNVVVKDSGIMETLEWMNQVLNRNIKGGLFVPGTVTQAVAQTED
ncbi:MAG TPA: BstXI family restriction endonuclease [Pyrinomonadaceae bacterium]|nr:BstXI family restriction endonuclease [Pyrinomonadaceae bacterium]